MDLSDDNVGDCSITQVELLGSFQNLNLARQCVYDIKKQKKKNTIYICHVSILSFIHENWKSLLMTGNEICRSTRSPKVTDRRYPRSPVIEVSIALQIPYSLQIFNSKCWNHYYLLDNHSYCRNNVVYAFFCYLLLLYHINFGENQCCIMDFNIDFYN